VIEDLHWPDIECFEGLVVDLPASRPEPRFLTVYNPRTWLSPDAKDYGITLPVDLLPPGLCDEMYPSASRLERGLVRAKSRTAPAVLADDAIADWLLLQQDRCRARNQRYDSIFDGRDLRLEISARRFRMPAPMGKGEHLMLHLRSVEILTGQ
jgi:hypothetical protein